MRYTFLLLATLLLATSCTTRKSRDAELRGIKKVWEDTHAKYNGYFNARELMRNTYTSLEEQHTDNYNEILPIYPFKENENVKAITPDVTTAIEKVSVVVSLHRKSQWTDDCYLLFGQAQHLLKDYEGAESTLRFMLDEYGPDDLARRKANADKMKKRGKKLKRKKGSKKVKDEEKYTEAKKSAKERARDRKDAAKERERYNKELRKKRKKEAKNRKKRKKNRRKKSSSKKPSKDTSPTIPKPEEKPDDKEKETETAEPIVAVEPGEEPVPTSIRLTQTGDPLDVSGDPDSYFMKHKPAYQDGRLWLAHVLIDRDNYGGAIALLSQLENDPKTFKDVRRKLAPLQAHYYLTQNDYEAAIPYLEKAVELADDRENKARYAFILGQISQELKQADRAYAAFEKAEKYSQDYGMIFNSRLFLAQNSWLAGGGSSEDTRRALNRMIKDPKNKEYLDRIHFTLARIALSEGNQTEAVAELEKSIKANGSDKAQRTESYLQVAELYYDLGDFKNAKKAYDQALGLLAKEDERHADVEKLSTSLTEIVDKELFIEEQDSLLDIAAMSEEDRRALAAELELKRAEAARKAALEKSNQKEEASNKFKGSRSFVERRTSGSNRVATAGGTKKSSFFAYDDRAVKRGMREFERKWGERALVDNWRISSVTIIDDSEEAVVAEDVPVTMTEGQVANILQGVPSTEEEIGVARLKMQEAMYELGVLYRERLGEHKKAVDILEELDKRFPRQNNEQETLYYLYLSLVDLGEHQRAEVYKKRLVEKFPNSIYTQILVDPAAAAAIGNQQKTAENAYDQAYQNLKAGNYQSAYDISASTIKKVGSDSPLLPKLELVEAMAIGNLQGKQEYINRLRQLTTRHKDTPEAKQADEMLRVLGAKSAALPGQKSDKNATDGSESVFTTNPKKIHYALIVIKDTEADLEDVKSQIGDYHVKYHKLDNLRVTAIVLGQKERLPVIVIRRFSNQDKAMSYYNGINQNIKDFVSDDIDYDYFIITQKNYREILKAKSIDGYKEFFEANY